MTFTHAGKVHTLRGMCGKKVQWVRNGKLQKAISRAAHICMIQLLESRQADTNLFALQSPITTTHAVTPSPILHLLEQFYDIFEEPQALPPRGLFDHRVLVIPGSTPVSIMPYRYPLKQRDIIEKLVQELLDKGIVQYSFSPFASPVVLVGKKDGT